MNLFRGLGNLKSISLKGNRLRDLKSATFENLEKLEHLSMEENLLSCLESSLLRGLVNLRNVNLKGNRLRSIEAGMFEGLKKLEKIIIGDNPLMTDGSFDFEHFESIVRTYCNFNVIIC